VNTKAGAVFSAPAFVDGNKFYSSINSFFQEEKKGD